MSVVTTMKSLWSHIFLSNVNFKIQLLEHEIL